MNRIKSTLAAAGIIAAFTTGALTLTSVASAAPGSGAPEMQVPATTVDHMAEAAKYDQEAIELDAESDRYTKMAARYRGLISGGGKQETAFRSLANHYQRLADFNRKAAAKAREMAASQRGTARGP